MVLGQGTGFCVPIARGQSGHLLGVFSDIIIAGVHHLLGDVPVEVAYDVPDGGGGAEGFAVCEGLLGQVKSGPVENPSNVLGRVLDADIGGLTKLILLLRIITVNHIWYQLHGKLSLSF